ncbi:ThiF family adenylyltransferase [Faecalispora anaeroviscerum]|uniref:ThiF family adenylyltransferase n=1 Tax=Faecalispora anaeroviscerum TaxID=2991836 RepID=UPI0024B94238|nr:ThiF family adenylyltransferase [Faecalispora anaeroviscerum]
MSLEEIADIVNKLNLKRNVNFELCDSTRPKYLCEYSGLVKLATNENLHLRISFSEYFPLSLPEIYVDDTSIFRAHVGISGKLCLFDSSAILVKQNMEGQILIDCFDQAMTILNIVPGSKKYNDEVCREFDSYWMAVRTKKTYSCLNTGDILFGEYPMVISKGISVVANTKNEAEAILQNNFELTIDQDTFERTCIVVRIRNSSSMIPLAKQYKWSTIRRYITENTSSSVKRQFRKFINKKVKHFIRYLLLIYPAKDGEILFGFRLEFNNSRFSKIENSLSCKVENTFCERLDYNYLLSRGGAASSLKNKSVLLLGCGSVGGYIANDLCQVGITNLDILDDDFFQAENIHRHLLGFDSLQPNQYKYKSDLVKKELESKFLYADIDSMNFADRSVQAFIQEPLRLSHYDLIISALGEPTLNLEINKILVSHNIDTPFLCCFNEPYGIGGHVIISNIDKHSCMQCLYTDPISSELVPFRGSLVAPDQIFKKNLSGCSSSFVPYSCLDSQQTAIYASRKSIEILTGKLMHNQIITWFGNADEFLSKGFAVSEFYTNNHQKKYFESAINTSKNCPVCTKTFEG